MPDCACSHSDGVTFTFRETWEGKLSRKKITTRQTKSDVLSMVAVTSHDPLLHE